jgi:hypothetical protein
MLLSLALFHISEAQVASSKQQASQVARRQQATDDVAWEVDVTGRSACRKQHAVRRVTGSGWGGEGAVGTHG